MAFNMVKDGFGGIGLGFVSGIVSGIVTKKIMSVVVDNKAISNLLSATVSIYANYELAKRNTIPENKLAMPTGIASGLLVAMLVDSATPGQLKPKKVKDLSDPKLGANTEVVTGEPNKEMVATADMTDVDVAQVNVINYVEPGKAAFNAVFTDNALRFMLQSDGVAMVYNDQTAWSPISYEQFKELVLKAKGHGLSKVFFLSIFDESRAKNSSVEEVAFLAKHQVNHEFVRTLGLEMADPLRPELQKISETHGFPGVLLLEKIASLKKLGIPISFAGRALISVEAATAEYPWIALYPLYQGQDVYRQNVRDFLLDEIAGWNAKDMATTNGKYQIYFITPPPEHREYWMQLGREREFIDALHIIQKEILDRGITLKSWNEAQECEE